MFIACLEFWILRWNAQGFTALLLTENIFCQIKVRTNKTKMHNIRRIWYAVSLHLPDSTASVDDTSTKSHINIIFSDYARFEIKRSNSARGLPVHLAPLTVARPSGGFYKYSSKSRNHVVVELCQAYCGVALPLSSIDRASERTPALYLGLK